MDDKEPVERRERKKKGERKSKRDAEDGVNLEGDSQRPMAASKSSRAPSSTRSESPQMDMPSSRPSSSHRRGNDHDRERVVRETVSFTKPQISESVRSQPIPVPKKVPSGDDDYDDDFEDYADDFEDDTDEAPAPTPKASRTGPSNSSVPKLSISGGSRDDDDMKALRQSMQQENSIAMERMQQKDQDGNNRDAKPSRSSIPTRSPVEGRSIPQAKDSTLEPETSNRKTKKSSGLMGFGKTNTMTLGPRLKRLQRLRESGVLDMQEEKALVLNVMPSTPFEVYHRRLFSHDPPIRQMGVPVELSTRDMEVNTEDIVMVDKEVQYVYGDDTSLINAMQRVTMRRRGQAEKEDDMMATGAVSSSGPDAVVSTEADDKGVDAGSGAEDVVHENRLNSFLQAAAQLCEDILNEEQAVSKQSDTGRTKRGILPVSMFSSENSDWQSLGGDGSDGSNELVRNRPVTAMAFSSLQPHLLMTAHPYDEADEEDLRPFKGIYCIWSTSSPGAPSVVLESSGQPTCCSFSGTQTFVVISGTAEGTLHLWDLRESNSIHANRDTIDLRIAKGLRKPCYSTHTNTSSNTADYAAYISNSKSHGLSDLEEEQHSCPIVQVEAVCGPAGSTDISSLTSAGVSQFISLETSGKAIVWAASHASSVPLKGENVDFGLSPWGRIKLVRQRVLYGSDASPKDSIFPHTLSSLGVIPGDTSSFLIACGGGGSSGSVSRVVRYGSSANGSKPKPSLQYGRRESATHIIVDSLSASNDSKCDTADPFAPIIGQQQLQGYTPPATCIAVSPHNAEPAAHSHSSFSSLVLVGRCDGSLDLYSLDSPDPLQSWTGLACYTKESASRGGRDVSTAAAAIVSAQWVPWKAAASFIVADASGRIYFFDLLKDSDKPLFVETVSVSALLPNTFRLSFCRSVGASVFIAVGDVDMPVSSGSLRIRKLHEDLMWQHNFAGGRESKNEEKEHHSEDSPNVVQNASWVGRTVALNVVTEYVKLNSRK